MSHVPHTCYTSFLFHMLHVFSISFFLSENTSMCTKTIVHYCSLVSVKPVDRSEMITQLQTTEVLERHMVMFLAHTHTHMPTKVINENKNYLKINLPNATNPTTNNTQTFLRLNPGHITYHQYSSFCISPST
jgi:regulator of sigma D